MEQQNKKFEQVFDVDNYEVETDTGWRDIQKVCKTIPYEVYSIELEDGKHIECADDHILFQNGKETFTKDLTVNDGIDTIDGNISIRSITKLGHKENMYDLQVDGHKYYSNGILSHNTTTVSAFVLWYAIFNRDKQIGIVSNKESSAKMILARIKKSYECLPNFLKPGVVEYSKTFIKFENGTKIIISATSPDAFRGESMNMLVADEFAFVPGNQAEDFWAANYPTISSSTTSKIIVVSTPNGLFNLFHRLYDGAEREMNSFKSMKISWEKVPGRDEEWAQAQINNLGAQQFNQEFRVHFLGSTNTVIKPEVLEDLMVRYLEPIKEDLSGRLRIWEQPEKDAIYVLGVDVGKGTGENWSVIQVMKILSMKPILMEQVAVFRDNLTDVYEFAEIINRLAKYYNDAHIMAENNNEGSAVVNRLWWEYENENLVNSGSKANSIGITATKKTKPKAVLLMKKLIEDGNITLHDIVTLEELGSFVEENKKFFGKDKPHDCISALYWALYIIEKDILDETYEFKKEDNEDIWGILADLKDSIEDYDFNWVTSNPFTD